MEDKQPELDALVGATARNTEPDLASLRRGMAHLPAVLERLKFKALRAGQDRAVYSILSGRDTIALLPTGQGKSLLYIAPTLAMDWKTLVFSPLISLMKDQVEKLWSFGIEAAQISSGQSQAENAMAINAWEAGELKILLVAPERLDNSRFVEALTRVRPNLVVVDEAHLIASWGSSFRSSYNKIGAVIDAAVPRVVLALTATATPDVEAEIRRVLGVPQAARVVYNPKRANLILQSRAWPGGPLTSMGYGNRTLCDTVNGIQGSVIVYCVTTTRCDELQMVMGHEVAGGCMVYHGKLTPEEKSTVQNRFMSGEVRVIIATNAFGMGIDKADIRGIIHRDVPQSVEEYVQQSGRAGRDGKTSHCMLFHDQDAYRTGLFFIDGAYPPRDVIEAVFGYINKIKDAVGEVRKTAKEIAESLRMKERSVSAAIGVLSANHALSKRSDNAAKIVSIVPLREHEDTNLQDLIDTARNNGNRQGTAYQIELDHLSQVSGVRYNKLTKLLRELSENGYIQYTPPYRGNTLKVVGDLSRVDFTRNDQNHAEAIKKLDKVWDFVSTPDAEKHDFLQTYFQQR